MTFNLTQAVFNTNKANIMDHYHEDLILVLEQLKLDFLQDIDGYIKDTFVSLHEGFCNETIAKYLLKKVDFIQAELDRLKVKYA